MNTKTRPSTLHWQPALLRPEEYVCGLDDIHQAIHIILRTPRGSDPHRPLFGSNLWHYIDYPIERAIPHVVRESVEAIRQWEPRCRLLKVTPVIDGEHLTLRVQWRAADDVINSTEVLWR
ncbi:GPW/gp25 family protein [Escherichia coli]|uniref:GPW/gp25 family protein n=1 Tax=Escherichia coli TaxID=562 RepID=UPI00138A4C97|nr:GPW/gp25 family protein [Escherichia coli]MBV0743184.1 GPW/gp25 family protein [Escherichia coli]QHS43595.1 baseplate protein [Escherichia coli]HAJ6454561.1 baseplate protein [Escherichia coli]HAL2070085.1 baseplate protein [Escherichia coli]HDW1516561.1 GPW/gp25 family protein [Escherichia coli]